MHVFSGALMQKTELRWHEPRKATLPSDDHDSWKLCRKHH